MLITMAKDYYENPARPELPYGQMTAGSVYDVDTETGYELITAGYATATATTITAAGPVEPFEVTEPTGVVEGQLLAATSGGGVVAALYGGNVIGSAAAAAAFEADVDVQLVGPLVSLICGETTMWIGALVNMRSDGRAYTIDPAEVGTSSQPTIHGYCVGDGSGIGTLAKVVLIAPLPVFTPTINVLLGATVGAGETIGSNATGEGIPTPGGSLDALEPGLDTEIIGALVVRR